MEKSRSPTFKKASAKDGKVTGLDSLGKGSGSSYRDVAFLFASALAELQPAGDGTAKTSKQVVVETESDAGAAQEDRDMQILRESWKSLVNLCTVAWMTVTLLVRVGYQMLLNRLRVVPKYARDLYSRCKATISTFVHSLIPSDLANYLKLLQLFSKVSGKKEEPAKSAVIVIHNFTNAALDATVIALLENYYVIRCEQQEPGWISLKRPSFQKLDDGIRIGLDFKKLDQVTKVSNYLQNLSIPVSFIVLGISDPSSEYYGQHALCRMLSPTAKKDMSVYVTASRVNVVQSFEDFESLAFSSTKSTSEIAVDVAALNRSIRGDQSPVMPLKETSKSLPEPLKKSSDKSLSSKHLTPKPLSAPKFADSITKILK